MVEMPLIEAVKQVLEEDPRTRDPKYSWTFFVKVLNKMGFRCYIEFDKGMPAPETLFRERREVLNKRNKYPETFVPEEGIIYGPPRKKFTSQPGGEPS